ALRAAIDVVFQAEDGIRDLIVTGVQTCALPIYTTMSFGSGVRVFTPADARAARPNSTTRRAARIRRSRSSSRRSACSLGYASKRSEERRVGKGGGAGVQREP